MGKASEGKPPGSVPTTCPSGDIVIDGAVVDISGNTIKVDGQQIGGN